MDEMKTNDAVELVKSVEVKGNKILIIKYTQN